MAIWPLSRAKSELSELVNRVRYGRERVVLSRHNKRVAALVSIEDLERLEALEDEADLEAAKSARTEESVSLDEVKRTLDL